MLTASMLIFGTIGIFRRLIPIPSATLACFRGVIGALFMILLAKIQGKKIKNRIGTKNVLLLVITGAVIGLNWIFLFEAYNYTSVATATLCYYMAPIFVIVLSAVLLKERITLKKGICAVAAVLGMVFVSGVAENGIPAAGEMKGVLYGLCAALLYSFVMILNKKFAGIDDYEKTIIQLGAAAAVILPYVLLSGQGLDVDFSPRTVILLLIVGILHTGVAYALYFGSFRGLSAQTVAVFSYLDPVTALILSAAVLKEPMTVYGIIGAVLIIGAALVSETGFLSGKHSEG